MLVLSWVAIPEAHPSPRFCVCVGSFLSPLFLKLPKGNTAVERTGLTHQGFTLETKFTYWESLTPEPLLHQ